MPTISAAHEVAWRLHEANATDAVVWYDVTRGDSLSAMHTDLQHITPDSLSTWELDHYRQKSSLEQNDAAPQPKPQLVPRNLFERRHSVLEDDRIVMVGAGAGSLLLASYLTQRGAKAENIVISDPAAVYGGIWAQRWAKVGGFNNPAPLNFNGSHQLSLHDRRGDRMHEYLRGIAEEHLDEARFVRSAIKGLARQRREGTWLTTDGDGAVREADYVVLANGTPNPRPIDGKRIKSNLDTVTQQVRPEQLIVERQQRELTDEELSSGRPIVLMGLGNSTGAMLRQIHAYEDRTGRQVDYKIISDLPEMAVLLPNTSFKTGVQPVFRNPAQGYLTGYSGDIEADRKNYYRAMHNIIPECTRTYFDPESNKLIIESPFSKKAIDKPHVFALLGFQRDETLLEQVGAMRSGLLRRKLAEPNIRPCDGAISVRGRGYNSNLFAIGAFAATRRNPNAAVVPGIQAQAPGTALTMAVRSAARRTRS